jgi:hypothetical protein
VHSEVREARPHEECGQYRQEDPNLDRLMLGFRRRARGYGGGRVGVVRAGHFGIRFPRILSPTRTKPIALDRPSADPSLQHPDTPSRGDPSFGPLSLSCCFGNRAGSLQAEATPFRDLRP